VELVPGDVLDAAAHRYGLRDAELAFHVAAAYDIGVVDEGRLERTNVDGTQAFLAALAESGTGRAVYVSSVAALGPVESGEGDESSHYSGPFPTVYHRTKTRAHQRALAAQQNGLPLIIVCPAAVYGPGDEGPGGRFMSDVVRGRLPALLSDSAWLSYVHVDDVVAGLVAAGEQGVPGATYVLSGEHARFNDVAARVAELAGVRPPRLRLPVSVALRAGTVLDRIARLTGLRFPLSGEGVRAVAPGRWLHSHGRATRELNWLPRSLDEGLPETVASLTRRSGDDG
jgi:nucleoside-diphosphate-sugar epimerase